TALPAQQSVPASAPASTPAEAPAGARSARNANYAISARLDPASRKITGDELLTWRNTSRTATSTLQFHLYYNAWRNSRSTWIRERARIDPKVTKRPESDWGWIEVTSLRVIPRGGIPADVVSQATFKAPDDGNVDDRTVMEVPLARPVAAGETVNVQI